jgi:hypothetical protein
MIMIIIIIIIITDFLHKVWNYVSNIFSIWFCKNNFTNYDDDNNLLLLLIVQKYSSNVTLSIISLSWLVDCIN